MPLVGLELTPLEGETTESGENRLAGEKVIEVVAGDTCVPLVGLEPTPPEGETAESGADRLTRETVIEVLAGGTGASLVGLESTPPEGETAYDSDSKTDWSESKIGVACETSEKLSSKDVAVCLIGWCCFWMIKFKPCNVVFVIVDIIPFLKSCLK